MKLAVVDDDADVRTAINRLLRALGHEVFLFASAEEFTVARPEADCLIVDIRLPGLNGLELRDRMYSAGHMLPVIFITGDGDRFLGDAPAPEAPTLHKPFDEETLMAALSDAVNAPSPRGR
jgi:FixJ family two-component response regulator